MPRDRYSYVADRILAGTVFAAVVILLQWLFG